MIYNLKCLTTKSQISWRFLNCTSRDHKMDGEFRARLAKMHHRPYNLRIHTIHYDLYTLRTHKDQKLDGLDNSKPNIKSNHLSCHWKLFILDCSMYRYETFKIFDFWFLGTLNILDHN